MNFEHKNVDQTLMQLTITVDKETFEKDYQKAFNKFSKQVQIDGFRKGKAPISVIEKRYTEQIKAFYVDEFVSDYYKMAIQTSEAKPITQGSFKDVNFKEDGQVEFFFEYEHLPTDFEYVYKDLEVPFKEVKYEEKLLDDTIKKILLDNAEDVPFDDKKEVAIGDKIKLLETESKTEMEVFEFDSVSLSEKINDAKVDDVIGKRLNDKFTVNEKEYQIVDAFRKTPPELNEETAKILGHDSVQAMKESLKENILKNIEQHNTSNFNYAVAYAFGEKNKENVKIPKDYLIATGKNMIMHQLGKQYGMSSDLFDSLPDDVVLEYAEKQRPNIVWDIAFDKIAQDHNITLTDDDFDKEIQKYADEFNISLEDFKMKYAQSLDGVRDTILSTKICDFIKPFCKIVEPKVDDSAEYTVLDNEESED